MKKEIQELGVGESVAEAKRLDAANGLSKVLREMRSSIDPMVSRLRGEAVFVVEQGSFITQGGAIIAVITITRLS